MSHNANKNHAKNNNKGGGLPDGWETLQAVNVYAKPDLDDPPLKRIPTKKQGVWRESFNVTNPVEVWIFENNKAPKDLLDTKSYGSWGYKPGTDDTNPKHCAVEDMWFFPPKAKLPKYFTPSGIWSFPVQKRDPTVLKPEEAGFLYVGKAEKHEPLDVAGNWRMLYQREGEPQQMQIHVKTPKGKVFTLDVEPTDTINQIRDTIASKHAIPKDEQRLRHGNKPLNEGHRTLENLGIQHNDTLDLEPMIIYVQDPANNNKQYTLNVDPTDKISKVKDKLEKQEGIPKKQQRLSFGGRPLSSFDTLREQNIKHKSVLILEPMKIYVRTPQGTKLPIDNVEPFHTIADIKSKVELHHKIPKEDQRLSFGKTPLNNDKATLEDCNIKHGDTLDLEPMHIIIKDWTGKTFPINIDDPKKDTIDQVKNKIEKEQGIQKKIQYLNFGGNFLEDPKTLSDYGIKHQDVVHLDRMKIYVQDWKGKTFTLEVDPNEQIETVKKMIQDREGMPVDHQILKFDGKLLENPKNLQDYGIQYKDTVNLSKDVPPPTFLTPTPTNTKPKVELPPEQTYTIRLSPYKDPFAEAYSPKKIQRQGVRAKSKDLLKDRWHTDLQSEEKELGQKYMQKFKKGEATTTASDGHQ